jgi:hypothetical protein
VNTLKVKTQKTLFISIGSKGTAGVIGMPPKTLALGKATKFHWVNVEEYGSSAKEVCESHGRGEATNFPCYDVGCYLSKRSGDKEKVTVYPLAQAIADKIVTLHVVNIVMKESGKTLSGVTVYAKTGEKWNASKTQPQYMACFDIPSRRIETGSISKDKRNSGLLATVQLPDKAIKTPKDKAKGKAKS